MSISNAQYTAWLAADARQREILVEVGCNHGGSEITRYLSLFGYGTGAADTPANTPYDARLKGQINLTRRVSISAAESSVQINLSSIDVDNIDGALDGWLEDVWEKRSVKVWIGDVAWARADFRQIFAGRVAAIKPNGRDGLSLLIFDEMQRLNFPVSETLLGGATVNKDAFIPQAFGEVFNLQPLLADPATHEYQWHTGAGNLVIEVRDNGAPVAYTDLSSTGKFRLSASPVGQITCDVQGAVTTGHGFTRHVAHIVEEIVTQYGDATTRLTGGEIDSANFSAFDTANPQNVGLYLASRTNVLEACNAVAASVQGSLHFSREGKLRLWRPPTAGGSPVMSFDASDMKDGSLQAVEILAAAPAVSVGWGRNWTVQGQLAGGLPASSVTEFMTEWRDVVANDPTAAALRRYTTSPAREETCLIVEAEANTEAAKRLAFRTGQHLIVEFQTTLKALELELGAEITVTHPRFGCGSGRSGWVIGAGEVLGAAESPFPIKLEVLL